MKDDFIFVGKAKVVEAVKDPGTVKASAELPKGDELQGLDGTSIGYVLPERLKKLVAYSTQGSNPLWSLYGKSVIRPEDLHRR